MTEWFSVKDRLPPDREMVLLLHDLKLREKYSNIYDSPSQITGYYMKECEYYVLNDLDEFDYYIKTDDITHWMPLPEEPHDL